MTVPLDQVFQTATLHLFNPDTTLSFPPEGSPDDWYSQAQSDAVERRQAYFDEQLVSLLVVRIPQPDDENVDPTSPSEELLDLVSHIQVSIEATYISPVQPSTNDGPRTATAPRTLTAPPQRAGGPAGLHLNIRTQPTGRLNPHPSILPPNTPNPMPATTDQDRQYTTAEGTPLVTRVWGSTSGEESESLDAFSLLWLEKEEAWIAVYRMGITVSFLRLPFADPLLCLTASATLREKPIPTNPAHPLTRFLSSLPGGRRASIDSISTKGEQQDAADEPLLLEGLEEINLFDGLSTGPTFSVSSPEDKLHLPSSRLGTATRQNLFSLAPLLTKTPTLPSPSPMTAARKAHPTLRKSFRKILSTASGFRVRMRTVFVPFVMLDSESQDNETEYSEKERMEAGSEERTVVLCVEVENSGEGGEQLQEMGFVVDSVDVKISGEGAKATLITWKKYDDDGQGGGSLTLDAATRTFPLPILPLAQYNLLYAVSFMRGPEESESFSFARANGGSPLADLQRAVTINIFGRPYFASASKSTTQSLLSSKEEDWSFPTRVFSSKWNCILDLAPPPVQPDPTEPFPSALPEPPSPFPNLSLYSASSTKATSANAESGLALIAGRKRLTLAGGLGTPIPSSGPFTGRMVKSLSNTPQTRSPLYTASPGRPMSVAGMNPPSLSLGVVNNNKEAYYLRSPTTYSAPPPTLAAIVPPKSMTRLEVDDAGESTAVPQTPAYPAFPRGGPVPPTPISVGPVLGGDRVVSSPVDVRRDRGDPSVTGTPPTPMPQITTSIGERGFGRLRDSSHGGENIVVSVGLLGSVDGKIYPLDLFTLDIFVFNQSGWTRRFEISCFERRRRRKAVEPGINGKMGYPGVLPMDSRVRIGPLRPKACQSVRMSFLAITPGVHLVEMLTLTDIETGYSVNLKSILDVVVHDPRDS